MPIMIWIAIIVEFAIQNWIDAGILLGIQFANATLGWCVPRMHACTGAAGAAQHAAPSLRARHATPGPSLAPYAPAERVPLPRPHPCRYETTKAADAVAALKKALKPLATCKRDGKWANMDATMLVPGDLVLLGAGAAVPADCIVNEGRIEVDQAALTGESLPVTMYKGDTPKMGSTSECAGPAALPPVGCRRDSGGRARAAVHACAGTRRHEHRAHAPAQCPLPKRPSRSLPCSHPR